MAINHLVLGGAVLTSALMAGLMYAYSCSVNPGLGKLSDENYVLAMQSINRAIQNPVFFLGFMGALILLPVAAWFEYRAGLSTGFWLMLIAALIYVVGVFGVTMAGNVPLNNVLDSFNLSSASKEEIARQRALFEIPWNRLHIVRTIASVISFVLIIIRCLLTVTYPGK